MQLLTKPIREKLITNYKQSNQPGYDPIPVVKFFTPDAGATWLIADMNPQDEILFGLCDLGLGCPELGYVGLDDLSQLRGPFKLPIERDRHTKLDKPLSAYTALARQHQHITC